MGPIKVISLHQPYASILFATRKDGTQVKPDETRGWRTPVRGRIIVHAAKKNMTADVHDEAIDLIDLFGIYCPPFDYGVLLGSIELADCVPTEDVRSQRRLEDLRWGDYSAGRWAWVLKSPRLFRTPILRNGRQGWWSVNPNTLYADALRTLED